MAPTKPVLQVRSPDSYPAVPDLQFRTESDITTKNKKGHETNPDEEHCENAGKISFLQAVLINE